jgi:hypothetical protein
MSAININSFDGHRISAENMNECGLIFSFDIVKDSHNQSPILNICIFRLVSKEIENWENYNGAKIFDEEYIIPLDLFS